MAPALSYFPESIDAAVGDKVKFVFMQKNHTVTQSTFADPCKKMENGMDSGFMPNADGKTGVEWEMDVKTTEPLCKLPSHDFSQEPKLIKYQGSTANNKPASTAQKAWSSPSTPQKPAKKPSPHGNNSPFPRTEPQLPSTPHLLLLLLPPPRANPAPLPSMLVAELLPTLLKPLSPLPMLLLPKAMVSLVMVMRARVNVCVVRILSLRLRLRTILVGLRG